MYDNLSRKIQDVTRKQIPLQLDDGEFAVFYNTEQRNHPSIIKVTNIQHTAVKYIHASNQWNICIYIYI